MLNTVQEIKPVYIDGLDCVDNTALTVCKSLRGEYEKVFWNSWRVRYKPDYVIGRGLIVLPGRIQDNIRRFYGIEFIPLGSFDRRRGRELITRILKEDGLLIAGLKANAFPWKEAYNQDVNGVHFLVLKGMGKEGVWCTDAMPKRENALLGWEDIRHGLLSLIRIQDGKAKCDVHLEKIVRTVKKNVNFQSIIKLQKKIETDFEAEREFGEQKNIWRVPLYNLFLILKGGHEQFEIYLRNSEFKKDTILIQSMHKLVCEWEALKVLTVKIHREFIANKLILEKERKYINVFVKRLGLIAQLEKETKDRFYNTYKMMKLRKSIFRVISDGEEWRAGSYIDLNYNEYTHMVNSQDFFTSSSIQYGVVWRLQKSEFYLPQVNENAYNCMYCDGQKIELEKYISKVDMLLYATYGAQFEQIEVCYEDGMDSLDFWVSDWTERPLHFEETAWSTEFRSKVPAKPDYMGKIAAMELYIDSRRICRSITLPRCEEIHIFAITVR